MIRIRGCDVTVDEASELATRLAGRRMSASDLSFVKALRRRVEVGSGGVTLAASDAAAIADVVAPWLRERRHSGHEVDRLEALYKSASDALEKAGRAPAGARKRPSG
jgi:hypothetical protein